MKKAKQLLATGLPLLVIAICAFGFLFAPNDPDHVDLSIRYASPSAAYPFGTDSMGRCMLSRILYGGKTTLGIILGGSAVVTFAGTFLGLMLGQGKTGRNVIFESVLNAVTAIPPIAYLIIFIGAWGNGISTMLVALTVSLILRLIKLVKAKTEIELRKAYVMCAVASGASKAHLLFVHITPNIIRDVLHFICLSCAEMVLSITGFSFIGLGLGDNVIDWGMMVADARSVIVMRPDIILYPIAFIVLCTLSFNLIGRRLEKRNRLYA